MKLAFFGYVCGHALHNFTPGGGQNLPVTPLIYPVIAYKIKQTLV